MSRSRQGRPPSRYSLSPERYTARLISISEAGTGINPAVLSMTIRTSAIPSAGRPGLPAKITSAICPPRSARGPCSPNTHAIASAMLDLPDPLGPTITLTPGVNSSPVLSANDLKPRIESDRRNTVRPMLSADAAGVSQAPREIHASMRNPCSPPGGSSTTSTDTTRPQAGPLRHHVTSRSTASAGPSKAASTVPSARFRTNPATPRAAASFRHDHRKPTPWTSPETSTRTRRRLSSGTVGSNSWSVRSASPTRSGSGSVGKLCPVARRP